MAGEHLFIIELKKEDYHLKIDLGGYEKLHLLQKYKECRFIHNQMSAWRERNDVPEEQKKAASDMYLNLGASLSFLDAFMWRAGINKKEIDEYMKLPF